MVWDMILDMSQFDLPYYHKFLWVLCFTVQLIELYFLRIYLLALMYSLLLSWEYQQFL